MLVTFHPSAALVVSNSLVKLFVHEMLFCEYDKFSKCCVSIHYGRFKFRFTCKLKSPRDDSSFGGAHNFSFAIVVIGIKRPMELLFLWNTRRNVGNIWEYFAEYCQFQNTFVMDLKNVMPSCLWGLNISLQSLKTIDQFVTFRPYLHCIDT